MIFLERRAGWYLLGKLGIGGSGGEKDEGLVSLSN